MELGLTDKVALVTASSKGLGKSTAMALAAEGAHVVVNGRDEAALARTAAEIQELGASVLAVVDDVTDPGAPERLVGAARAHFGALHVLVGNAGGPPPGRALDVTDEQLAEAINANLLTSVRLVRAAVPAMKDAGWGRIALITSVSVKQPIPTLALSNTARTGLWAWAKTAALDLVYDGITLNLACPGLHETDRMKELAGQGSGAGPMGDPDDFGKVVAFLCSEPARFITGTAVAVDGGAVLGLL